MYSFRQHFSAAYVGTVNTATSAHFALGTNTILSHSAIKVLLNRQNVSFARFYLLAVTTPNVALCCSVNLSAGCVTLHREDGQALLPI